MNLTTEDVKDYAEKFYFSILKEGDTIRPIDLVIGFAEYETPSVLPVSQAVWWTHWNKNMYPMFRPTILRDYEDPYDLNDLVELVFDENINETDNCVEYFSQQIVPIEEMPRVLEKVENREYTVAIRRVYER